MTQLNDRPPGAIPRDRTGNASGRMAEVEILAIEDAYDRFAAWADEQGIPSTYGLMVAYQGLSDLGVATHYGIWAKENGEDTRGLLTGDVW